jgi:hypothetical protein
MKKAFKQGFAAVLSVMMVLCFMPAMAFAGTGDYDPEATFSDDYATVTDSHGKTFQTARTFHSSGEFEATGVDDMSVIGDPKAAPSNEAWYYDLDGSMLTYNDGTEENPNFKKLDGTTWKLETFFAQFFDDISYGQLLDAIDDNSVIAQTGYGFQLVMPAYAEGYATATAADKKVDIAGSYDHGYGAGFNGYNTVVKIEFPENFTPFSEEDQTVTFTVKSTALYDIKAEGVGDPDMLGKVASAEVKIKGQPMTPDYAQFYLDQKNDNGVYGANSRQEAERYANLTGYYDGATHTVVTDTVPGYNVSYSVYNKETGKWVATDPVALTDVQEEVIDVKATFTPASGAKVVKYFTVNLVAPYAYNDEDYDYPTAAFGFDAASFVTDTTFNPEDHLVINPFSVNTKYMSDANKKLYKEKNEAAQKAVEANKAAIKEYMNDWYDIVSEDGNYGTWSFEPKDLSEKEEAALDKKYEALERNLGATNGIYAGRFYVDEAERAGYGLYPEIDVYKHSLDIFVDNATAVEGTAPDLKYSVFMDGEAAPDFDTSKLHFTTVGGQELDQLKPGTYKLVATAENYSVSVHGVHNTQMATLTVTKKATPTKATTIKVSNTSKTYKAKALKKSAKTFTVSAKANSGAKVTFAKSSGSNKLTINKSGKVTVKKGTKKGTYTMKVKAKAPAKTVNGVKYKAKTKTFTVKVVVKKK